MEIMVCDVVATYLMILLLVCCDTPCRYSVLALPYIIVCATPTLHSPSVTPRSPCVSR